MAQNGTKSGRSWRSVGLIGVLMGFVLLLPLLFPTSSGSVRNPKLQFKLRCMSNLRIFAELKNQWAVRYKKSATERPTDTDLFGTDDKILQALRCPAGGLYTLSSVGEMPRCSIPDHTI